MRLRIAIKVNKDYQTVARGFTEKLFRKLNPPFPPARLHRYDGSQPGDRVVLKLSFLLFSQWWESEITDQQTGDEEINFTDEGRVLPFFLNTWRHVHCIQKRPQGGSTIVEDIQFSSGYAWADFFLFVPLYLLFAYRIPIYKNYFK